MLYTFIKSASIAFLILTHLNAFATGHDSIDFQVRIPKWKAIDAKDLIMEIQLRSHKTEPLIFAKDPPAGFFVRKNGALRVQLQSQSGDKYVDFPVHGSIDFFPAPLDTIKNGEARMYKLSISRMYPQLPKGAHRVRVLIDLSSLNPQVKDKYSKWIYFICEKDIDAWASNSQLQMESFRYGWALNYRPPALRGMQV